MKKRVRHSRQGSGRVVRCNLSVQTGVVTQGPVPSAALTLGPPQALALPGWSPARLTTPLMHTSVPSRGLEGPPRGWSVSLHSGDSWQDLAGCDFVLDLIGQTEDLGDPADPHSYPIAPQSL